MASIRALRKQATSLLLARLKQIAAEKGLSYRSSAIKQLKSRWGSCDQHANITLNLYLVQLPWHLIDYVILHELAHTQVLHHGPDFWDVLERLQPNARSLRRAMKEYRPTLLVP
jgi:predicted metal-dependent hydrolase